MGQIEAEVDRGLPHLGLQVTCLSDRALDERYQLSFDLVWLQVPEVCRESLLDKLEQAQIIL